jgi:hypothetical protein
MIQTLRIQYGRADMRFKAIFILAILAFLTGLVAKHNAAFCRRDWRRMGIPTMGIGTLETKFTEGWRLRPIWKNKTGTWKGGGGERRRDRDCWSRFSDNDR